LNKGGSNCDVGCVRVDRERAREVWNVENRCRLECGFEGVDRTRGIVLPVHGECVERSENCEGCRELSVVEEEVFVVANESQRGADVAR
jgi:hypothetical protein